MHVQKQTAKLNWKSASHWIGMSNPIKTYRFKCLKKTLNASNSSNVEGIIIGKAGWVIQWDSNQLQLKK